MDRTGPAPLFGLAPGGVCRASLSPGCWWALTPPFHPYRLPPDSSFRARVSPNAKLHWRTRERETINQKATGGIFLLHFPYPGPDLADEPWTVDVIHHRVLWSPDFPLSSAATQTRTYAGQRPPSRLAEVFILSTSICSLSGPLSIKRFQPLSQSFSRLYESLPT